MVGFRSASLFPARKWEAVTKGGSKGTDHLTRRLTQGVGIPKAGRTSETTGAFRIHSHKARITPSWGNRG